MKPTDDSTWTPEESEALEALATPLTAPDSLERGVVERLTAQGALRSRPSIFARVAPRPAFALAAMLVIFAAGFWTGRLGSEPAQPLGVAGQRTMLLLYEDDAFIPAPPGQEPGRVEEYRQWVVDVREAGLAASGDELTDDARFLRSEDGTVRVDPTMPAAGAGRVSGYIFLETGDMQRAVEVASTMPHLTHGGSIGVVRLAGHGQ